MQITEYFVTIIAPKGDTFFPLTNLTFHQINSFTPS